MYKLYVNTSKGSYLRADTFATDVLMVKRLNNPEDTRAALLMETEEMIIAIQTFMAIAEMDTERQCVLSMALMAVNDDPERVDELVLLKAYEHQNTA